MCYYLIAGEIRIERKVFILRHILRAVLVCLLMIAGCAPVASPVAPVVKSETQGIQRVPSPPSDFGGSSTPVFREVAYDLMRPTDAARVYEQPLANAIRALPASVFAAQKISHGEIGTLLLHESLSAYVVRLKDNTLLPLINTSIVLGGARIFIDPGTSSAFVGLSYTADDVIGRLKKGFLSFAPLASTSVDFVGQERDANVVVKLVTPPEASKSSTLLSDGVEPLGYVAVDLSDDVEQKSLSGVGEYLDIKERVITIHVGDPRRFLKGRHAFLSDRMLVQLYLWYMETLVPRHELTHLAMYSGGFIADEKPGHSLNPKSTIFGGTFPEFRYLASDETVTLSKHQALLTAESRLLIELIQSEIEEDPAGKYLRLVKEVLKQNS